MIFRTGSCLIVGHCDEGILDIIYNFLKNILINESMSIQVENAEIKEKKKKEKKKRKRQIIIW